MKKIILSVVALTVIGLSACKKEKAVQLEFKKDNIVAAKDLGAFDKAVGDSTTSKNLKDKSK